MDKFVGKWKMLPDRSNTLAEPLRKDSTYTIQRVENDMMMIQSEWKTHDNKSRFLGYTVHTDGIPRKVSGGDGKYVTKVRGRNKMTTSRIEDEQVKAMEVREVLDTGELKVTRIIIGDSGEQQKYEVYFRKVDTAG